jgi:hypothetical protein
VEPIIKAAEADLVIFGVGLGSGFLCMDPFNIDIFIYHPAVVGRKDRRCV